MAREAHSPLSPCGSSALSGATCCLHGTLGHCCARGQGAGLQCELGAPSSGGQKSKSSLRSRWRQGGHGALEAPGRICSLPLQVPALPHFIPACLQAAFSVSQTSLSHSSTRTLEMAFGPPGHPRKSGSGTTSHLHRLYLKVSSPPQSRAWAGLLGATSRPAGPLACSQTSLGTMQHTSPPLSAARTLRPSSWPSPERGSCHHPLCRWGN